MNCLRADNREATLADLAYQAQSLIDPRDGYRKVTKKEGSRTEVVQRNSRDSKESGKVCRAIALKNTGTLSTSDKHEFSAEKIFAQVVNPNNSTLYTSHNDSDQTFIDSSAYCQVCYSSSHATSQYHHLKQNSQLVRVMNGNYVTRFGTSGDLWGRCGTLPVATHRFSNEHLSPKTHSIKAVTNGTTYDMQHAMVQDRIGHSRIRQISGPPALHHTPDFHRRVVKPIRTTSYWGSWGGCL